MLKKSCGAEQCPTTEAPHPKHYKPPRNQPMREIRIRYGEFERGVLERENLIGKKGKGGKPGEEKRPGGVEADVHHRRAVAAQDSGGIGRWPQLRARHGC